MNEIGKNQEYDDLIFSIKEAETKLADLVYDRDQLIYHICPKIKTEYMLKIGKLEYAIFEYQCKILRIKRKIEIIQSFLNKEQVYNIAEIDNDLDHEYQEYTKKLLEKQQEIEQAQFKNNNPGKLLSSEEASELKNLYIQIVKKLHPDINPDTTEKQHDQFIDAVNAYEKADLSELRIIFLLLEKTAVTETTGSMDKLKKRKESLLFEIDNMLDSIKKIHETFPYNTKELLQNKELLKKEIDKSSAILTEKHEQLDELENHLEAMIKPTNE